MVAKREGKRPLARSRSSWNNNIKNYFEEIVVKCKLNRVGLVQDPIDAVLDRGLNLWVPLTIPTVNCYTG
jgi:hypothetical protein